MSSTPDDPTPGNAETSGQDDLVLAQALDAALDAAQRAGEGDMLPSTSAAQPKTDLRPLVEVAEALRGTAPGVAPSPRFRAAARKRLMERLAVTEPLAVVAPVVTEQVAGRPGGVAPRRPAAGVWRGAPWFIRAAAALVALVFVSTTAVGVSANALPGDPFYAVKQAREAVVLRLADDEAERLEVLLRQADARLEEAARLFALGRVDAAVDTAERYDETVEQATSTLLQSLPTPPANAAASAAARPAALSAGALPPTVEMFAGRLRQQRERLSEVVAAAPAAAQPALQSIREAPERGLRRASQATAARMTGDSVLPPAREPAPARQFPAPAPIRPNSVPPRRPADPTATPLPAPPTLAVPRGPAPVVPSRVDNDERRGQGGDGRDDSAPTTDGPGRGDAPGRGRGRAEQPVSPPDPEQANREPVEVERGERESREAEERGNRGARGEENREQENVSRGPGNESRGPGGESRGPGEDDRGRGRP